MIYQPIVGYLANLVRCGASQRISRQLLPCSFRREAKWPSANVGEVINLNSALEQALIFKTVVVHY